MIDLLGISNLCFYPQYVAMENVIDRQRGVVPVQRRRKRRMEG